MRKGQRRIQRLKDANGRDVRFLMRNGRQVWPCRKALPIPQMEFRMVHDDSGFWFEVGFQSIEELEGSASTGWRDSRGYCNIALQQSVDLQAWNVGTFEDCPGSPEIMEDGAFRYWSRSRVPNYWEHTLVDFTATSSRYGKSIVGLSLFNQPVALPGYPYAMPTDAARLQADLRANGYPGAVVASTAGNLVATAKNHTPDGAKVLFVTMSGTNVANVVFMGSTIPLPAYPYSMPSQKALLQSHLRAAGYSGAVVMLFKDEWQLFIPNRIATGNVRNIVVDITPGDPYPAWDMFGAYQGEVPATVVVGTPGNIRDPFGNPLLEATKQFARLAITRGDRVLP